MPLNWSDMPGNWQPVALAAEALGLAGGRSTDYNHLVATAVRRCRTAAVVVGVEASHEGCRGLEGDLKTVGGLARPLADEDQCHWVGFEEWNMGTGRHPC